MKSLLTNSLRFSHFIRSTVVGPTLFCQPPFRLFSYDQSGTPRTYAKPRMSFNNKRIQLKGYSILRDDVQFSVTPAPALYKELDNSYVIDKNGYVVCEFCPMMKETYTDEVSGAERQRNKLDTKNKRNVIVTMKNIRDIIELDTTRVANNEKEQEMAVVQFKENNNDSKTITPSFRYNWQSL